MTESTERALMYDQDEFTASDLLLATADLIKQFGFNPDTDSHKLSDVPGTAGYALHEALDQAAFGQPIEPLLMEMGLQPYPEEYRKAALLIVGHVDNANHGDDSPEATNGWHQAQTQESVVNLLRYLAADAATEEAA